MSEPHFRTRRQIEFCDTDLAGIVHFANFFRFMESAEHAFLRSRGLSVVMDWEGEHLGFPRVAASCDYLKPARFEEVLDVLVSIERLGAKSITYNVEFFRTGELLAKGSLTCVCCRVSRGEPGPLVSLPIPAGIRARLETPA